LPKVALIFGVTGQDGSYLSEILIEKGYVVHGVRRRSSSFNTGRIDHLIRNNQIWEKQFKLHYGNLEDSHSIHKIICEINPDEIYNLAAQSHVGLSFEQPIYTSDVDALGNLRILESIRLSEDRGKIKFYQASTSELFGGKLSTGTESFDENSPLIPKSPYASAKLMAYWNTRIYREAYEIFAVNGILFNHESPRRGETFVTRKITMSLARIKFNLQNEIVLGNLDAIRDWGYAPEYMEAAWKMLQQDAPQDYVISTGVTMSVREFIQIAARLVDIEIEWRNSGLEEVGIDTYTGRTIVRVDAGYFRPLEVDYLMGNSAKAQVELNWRPSESIENLIAAMMAADLLLADKEASFPGVQRV
jgi:GDPmannose 4,6-dehydratase